MSDDTTQYPHVTDGERKLVERYGELLNNTGGNDPLDLLNDLRKPNSRMMTTNIVRFLLATAVSSQIGLLATLEAKHMLPDRGDE